MKFKNKLHKAYALSYLINNKKIAKVLKSTYLKDYNKLLEELNELYSSETIYIDIRTFFNSTETTNNIFPSIISTQDYINYNLSINFMIKNKHIIENIFQQFKIEDTKENIKLIKSLMNNKINDASFISGLNGHSEVLMDNDILSKHGFTTKNYKEIIHFKLPNIQSTDDINAYPLIFVDMKIENTVLVCKLFFEEDINSIAHKTIPKNKVKKYLLS